ncbi:MAG TPA: hypothetical protein VGD46_23375 [Rhizobacter sp.]
MKTSLRAPRAAAAYCTFEAMHPSPYDGPDGLARMKAHMRAAFAERALSARDARAEEYFRGWLHGLADGGGADDATLMAATQFVYNRGYEQPDAEPVELYPYPDDSFSRVEGKSRGTLEEELLVGGPYPYGRVSRIYDVAGNPQHPLYFVARHYLFLTRARAPTPAG